MTTVTRLFGTARDHLRARAELRAAQETERRSVEGERLDERERRLVESTNRARSCCGHEMRQALPDADAVRLMWSYVHQLSERARLLDDAYECQRLNEELAAVTAQLDHASRHCDVELAYRALRRLRRLASRKPNGRNEDCKQDNQRPRIELTLRFADDVVARLRRYRRPPRVISSTWTRQAHTVGRGRTAPPWQGPRPV